MNQLDDYGRGRLAVIREMTAWLDKEIDKVKSLPEKDVYARSLRSGLIKAFINVKRKLDVKYNRLKTNL